MLINKKKIFSICTLSHLEYWFDRSSLVQRFSKCLLVSWVFALCAQVVIPLPFNLVPLVLNPLPLLLAAQLLGMNAVYAYGLYLVQGFLGMPFFLGLQSGPAYLLGPTGGYTLGFAVAMLLLAKTRTLILTSRVGLSVKLFFCAVIYFGCGLAQLSLFVQPQALFTIGLYPFILGDACKLLAIMILF